MLTLSSLIDSLLWVEPLMAQCLEERPCSRNYIMAGEEIRYHRDAISSRLDDFGRALQRYAANCHQRLIYSAAYLAYNIETGDRVRIRLGRSAKRRPDRDIVYR